MFGHDHYVPILKGKGGEFAALGWLTSSVAEALTPLVEFVEPPFDYKAQANTKTLDKHLSDDAGRLIAGWTGGGRVFLDTIWIDSDALADGKHHLEYLFDECRGKIAAVPVGGLTRGQEHEAAIAAIHGEDEVGAVLRLDAEDLEELGVPLETAVDAWLEVVGITAAECDLVVDLGALPPGARGTMRLFARTMLPALPRVGEWRTLTIASSAFPDSLTNLATDTEHFVARDDFLLWQSVIGAALPRLPSLGDYAITDPTILRGPMRAGAAAIRYTLDDLWMIVKRQSLSATPGYGQFNDASAILAARSEFMGAEHCKGCEFIASCGAGGPRGNQTTWRTVGTCHHLTKTTQQLASLGGTAVPSAPPPATP